MEEARKNIIPEDATVTLSADEYRDLIEDSIRYEMIYSNTRINIETNRSVYRKVNEEFILSVLGLDGYSPKSEEE